MSIKLSQIFSRPFAYLYRQDPREVVLLDPRATGKTYTLAHECVFRMLQNPDKDALCIRKTHRSLEGSVVAELKEAIQFFGVGGEWEYNKTEKVFTNIYTKQHIYCSGSEAEYIKGIKPVNKLCYFFIDEIQQLKDLYELSNIMATFARNMTAETYVRYSGNNHIILTHWTYKFKEDKRGQGIPIHSSTYKDIEHLLSSRILDEINYLKNTDKFIQEELIIWKIQY